jgi:hypothetical protein
MVHVQGATDANGAHTPVVPGSTPGPATSIADDIAKHRAEKFRGGNLVHAGAQQPQAAVDRWLRFAARFEQSREQGG